MVAYDEPTVPGLETTLRGALGTGRCAAMAREHLDSGGRRFRARLAERTALAFGVEPGAARGWAAAVELVHNASLVHDDVQDGDRVRRGQPSVYARHGVAQAINVGDLLLMAPFELVAGLTVPAEVRVALCAVLARRCRQIVAGQAEELALSVSDPRPLSQVVAIVAAKTSGLFVLPVEGALLLAGFDPARARSEAERFAPLGARYQLQDDLDDLFDQASDLRAGRLSAPIAAHLEAVPGDRFWVCGWVGHTPDADARADIAERFRRSGAIDRVQAEIQRLTAEVLGGRGDSRIDAVLAEALRALGG